MLEFPTWVLLVLMGSELEWYSLGVAFEPKTNWIYDQSMSEFRPWAKKKLIVKLDIR